MRQRHHRPIYPHPTDIYDQLLLLLLIAQHREELGIMDDIQAYIDQTPPVAFDMDCKEVRQAIAAGEDPQQYQKAFDLYTRTGSTELLSNLRGVKVSKRRIERNSLC
jgi:hypothetical protein